MTRDEAAPIRAVDCMLFQTIQPHTRDFLWTSVNDVSDDGQRVDVLCLVSHRTDGDGVRLRSATRAQLVKGEAQALEFTS